MNRGPDYDIVIIGAGIHGVGIAQAAAAAGYRTLVLEQAGVASGTSSRSSKLIHGGLRYLEQFRFGLVYECLRERELLLRIAPELVKLQHFLIPIYRDSLRRPWQIRTGLSLYALLSKLGTNSRFDSLPASHWSFLDGLSTARLQAVFRYQDAQTDDALLTKAVMASAMSLGAELLESARFIHAEDRPDGCEIVFEQAARTRQLHSRVLVNAAGPWVQQVADRITPNVPQPPIELVQGSHVLLTAPAVKDIYYLEAPQDKRAVFVMPWQNQTLVGTTETPFTGNDPATVFPSHAETDYLQEVVAHYFPATRTSLIASFAGLRVLPAQNGRPFGRSRELLITRDTARQPHVLHLYGGKLTSYRADSERVIQRLRLLLHERPRLADTRQLHLDPV
jgi:glycerol-3-phosphate dehydrogenase